MDANPKQKLKELYQALYERPLDPAKQQDAQWYVPYIQAGGDTPDPIAEICNEINFSESESLHYVTGQRGTGKSTELLRLRQELTESGLIVLYVDMLEYLHMAEPAEISDFLLAVSAGLANQVAEHHGLSIQESYWDKIKIFLKRLEFDKAVIKSSLKLPALEFGADLSARLKADDTFKQQLQQAIRGHTNELVNQVHDFSRELVAVLRTKYNNPDLQIAVIVDSFEQIRGYYGNVEQVHKSVVRLFGADGKHLRLPTLHTVITVPPYLSGATDAGLMPVSLPSVHVRHLSSGEPDMEGIRVLQNMVYQRSVYAREIFTDAALQTLAVASGGDIRDYFLMVKSVLVKAGSQLVVSFPVADNLLQQAQEKLRRSMMPVDDVSTRWLFRVQETKQVELEEQDDLSDLALLFDRHLVIHYQNGEDWYDIHPLIKDYVIERQRELDEREAQ
jgi:hypothetical protein